MSRTWAAHVAREPLSRPARLLAGALADRADRHGRVSTPLSLVASCCCLSAEVAADAAAELAGQGLLATLPGGTHVLARPLHEAGAAG